MNAGNWQLHTVSPCGIRLWIDGDTTDHRVFGADDATEAQWTDFLWLVQSPRSAASVGFRMNPSEIADAVLSDLAALHAEHRTGVAA